VRYSGPDLRDLTNNPQRFVLRRSQEGRGFNYLPRAWLETGIRAYFAEGRSRPAAIAAFRAAVPGRKGITEWKRNHARSMEQLLDRFIDTELANPRPTEVLFRARPRITVFHGHELAVRLDLWCPGSLNIVRCIWTDQKSRLGRRGTTPRVAALAIHAAPHVAGAIDAVEVWQLRYRHRVVWPIADLERHNARLRTLMYWATQQCEGRSAS
jgi:hypothetical protein